MTAQIKRKGDPRPGMWATLGTIVQSGWGPTLRFLSIIVVTSIAFGEISGLVGSAELLEMLRSLVVGD
jgi:hypothetical protein